MTDAISHRGPDGEGACIDVSSAGDQVALGHRRLAIIDPAGGAQPMHSADGNLSIVFNGEIYNFRELRAELAARHGSRFRTDCDTEVLLEAYRIHGADCLPLLRGMFAFAIWDRARQSLFLARDPLGKKPLFLLTFDDGFAFASEIKSLLACSQRLGRSPALNVSALPGYFLYRYVPGPETFFDGVRKLPPGCFATWSVREPLSVQAYYELPHPTPAAGRTVEGAIEGYRQELERAVNDRLVSDAPFGAFLSGGVDSASIVGLMARRLSNPVRTFSIGFAEDASSELPAARRVAQAFDTDHTELVVSSHDILHNIEDAIRACDAPVSEPASIALLLLSREASRSVKMVLSGEGADETMGGYGKHSLERFAALYARAPSALRTFMSRTLSSLPGGMAKKLGASLETLGVADRDLRHALWFGGLRPQELGAMAGKRAYAANASVSRDRMHDFDSLLRFDQLSWLPDNLLERGDRMTMAASIEARMPFMDQDLIALSWTIPGAWKVRGFTGKWLLRRAMKGVLPDHVLHQRKRGFPMPVAAWVRGPLKQEMHDVLLGPDSVAAAVLGRQDVAALLAAHLGGADRSKALWQLYNLNKFCSLYGLRA